MTSIQFLSVCFQVTKAPVYNHLLTESDGAIYIKTCHPEPEPV